MPAWLVPAAVALGSSIAQGGANAAMQGKMNAKNRGFAEDMWKKDADQRIGEWQMQNSYNESMWSKQKAYNEQVWHMQNEYDSPAAQMQRFRDAGLNPNLIYGQSNMGGSFDTAQMENAPLSSGEAPHAVGQAPPAMDLQSAMQFMSNFRTAQLQNDNLQVQNSLYKKEGAIKDAQVAGLNIENMQKLFDYNFNSDMRDVSADYKRQMVNNLRSQMDQRLYNYDLDVRNLDLKRTQVGQYVKQSNQAITESIARTDSTRAGIGLIHQNILSSMANRDLTRDKELSEEQRLQIGEIQKRMMNQNIDNAESEMYMKFMQMILGGMTKGGRK